MKIVALYGKNLSGRNFAWERLERLGETVFYPKTENTPQAVYERAKGAEIVLINNRVTMTGEIMDMLREDLKYIGVMSTGYNNVDVKAAKERGILVTNVPEYGTSSVAQHTIALLLEITNRVGDTNRNVREKGWAASADRIYRDALLFELYGKTMGLIGFGDIGQAVAKVANALGMRVLYYRGENKKIRRTSFGEAASLDHLLGNSDVISLHCPLTPKTEHIVDEKAIGKMKRTAILINTARGGLVEEKALADALNRERIAAAGLDVVSQEPLREDNPLAKAKNCIITPHLGWATAEARRRLFEGVIDNVEAYVAGDPKNIVS